MREIYEGDILKVEDSYAPTYNASINWVDSGFWVTDGRGGNFLPAPHTREVIGNIYENKELLKN